MLLNQPFLPTVILLLLVNFAFASTANADSRQNINVFVPKVALINVQKTNHHFSFSSNNNTVIQRTQVAITSSNRKAALEVSSSQLPSGITLKISASDNVCSLSTQSNENGRMSCKVGLKAIKNGEITLFAKRGSKVMDGDYTVTISSTIK